MKIPINTAEWSCEIPQIKLNIKGIKTEAKL